MIPVRQLCSFDCIPRTGTSTFFQRFVRSLNLVCCCLLFLCVCLSLVKMSNCTARHCACVLRTVCGLCPALHLPTGHQHQGALFISCCEFSVFACLLAPVLLTTTSYVCHSVCSSITKSVPIAYSARCYPGFDVSPMWADNVCCGPSTTQQRQHQQHHTAPRSESVPGSATASPALDGSTRFGVHAHPSDGWSETESLASPTDIYGSEMPQLVVASLAITSPSAMHTTTLVEAAPDVGAGWLTCLQPLQLKR